MSNIPYNLSKTPQQNLNDLLVASGFPEAELSKIEVVGTEYFRGDDHNATITFRIPADLANRMEFHEDTLVEDESNGNKLVSVYMNKTDAAREVGNTYYTPRLVFFNNASSINKSTLQSVLKNIKLDSLYAAPEQHARYSDTVPYGHNLEFELQPRTDNGADKVATRGRIYVRAGMRLDRFDNPTLFAMRFAKSALGQPDFVTINNTGAKDANWNKQITKRWIDADQIGVGNPLDRVVLHVYRADKKAYLESIPQTDYQMRNFTTEPTKAPVTAAEVQDILSPAVKQLGHDYTRFNLYERFSEYNDYFGANRPNFYIQRRDLKEALPEFDAHISGDMADSQFWQPLNRTTTSLGGGQRNAWVIENLTSPTPDIARARMLMNKLLTFLDDLGWNRIAVEESTSVTYPAKKSLVKCFVPKEEGKPYVKGKMYLVVPYVR